MSRQTRYSEKLADKICEQLMDGKSLVAICRAKSMPHRSTVIRWMEANELFATRCARAREAQADYMDDLILDTARTCTQKNAMAAKVKISAYQWRAEKLKPKKYGARTALEMTGADGAALAGTTVYVIGKEEAKAVSADLDNKV